MFSKGLTEFRVGLFVIAGFFLAMMIIFMISGEHKLFQREYTLYASFSDISGLRTGAPVQLAGLRVGYVDTIKLARDLEKREILVVIKIQREFADRIRADSVATVETQGLLGDKFVYISMGTESEPVISDRGVLPTKTTTSIFALAEKAGEIMDDIGKASEAVNEMLTSVRGKKEEGDIKAIVSSVRRSIEQIEKGKGLLHAMIYDSSGEKVVASLAKTMEAMEDIAAGAERAGKGEMGGLIVNLRRASADLKIILDSVRRGEGTMGKLVSDPALYDDLRALVGRASRNKLLRAVIRSTISENEKQVLK